MYNNIFKKQLFHLLAIVVFIVITQLIVSSFREMLRGSLFGISTKIWLYMAVITPIIHQLYVALIWRLELYTSIFTDKLGLKLAFKIYAIGFSILFVFRLIFITFLAFSSQNSLDINPIYTYLISAFIAPFIIYLFYSVIKYFTLKRAYGIDHFDKKYNVPYVKQGIFKYTDNGMYIFGLMILYLPGLLLLSKAAILVAFLNHLYILVHYYTIERPDMEYIYGNTP